MLKSCTLDPKSRTLTVVLELEEPRPSASGKTQVLASTNGNTTTEAKFNGRPVIVGCNAYFKP